MQENLNPNNASTHMSREERLNRARERSKILEISLKNETDENYLNYCAIELLYDIIWDDENYKILNINEHRIIEIEKRIRIGLKLLETNPFYYIEKQINQEYLDTFNQLVKNLLPNKNLINVDLNPTSFEKKLDESSIIKTFETNDIALKEKARYFSRSSMLNRQIAEKFIAISNDMYISSKNIEELIQIQTDLSRSNLIIYPKHEILSGAKDAIKLATEFLLKSIEYLVSSVNFSLLSQKYIHFYKLTKTYEQKQLQELKEELIRKEKEKFEEEYFALLEDMEKYKIELDLDQITYDFLDYHNSFDGLEFLQDE